MFVYKKLITLNTYQAPLIFFQIINDFPYTILFNDKYYFSKTKHDAIDFLKNKIIDVRKENWTLNINTVTRHEISIRRTRKCFIEYTICRTYVRMVKYMNVYKLKKSNCAFDIDYDNLLNVY